MTTPSDYLIPLSPDNAASLKDPETAKSYQAPLMQWLGNFTPAPALIGMAGQA